MWLGVRSGGMFLFYTYVKFRDSVKDGNLLISSVIINLSIRISYSDVGCGHVTLYGPRKRDFDVSCSAKLQS